MSSSTWRALRGAPRDTRCPIAVGAPVTQEWGSLVWRNMARRPRTATAPLVVDPESPLCPSIAENHGVDERSRRGVFAGSRAGTKLGGLSPALCYPLTPGNPTIALHRLQGSFVSSTPADFSPRSRRGCTHKTGEATQLCDCMPL